MTISVESGVTLSEHTEQLIREKLEKLEIFFDRIERANIYINQDDGNQAGSHVVEIRLAVPGPDLFAAAEAETIDKAFIEVVEKIRRQLKRHKEKMNNQ
jgi:putative sigma-54 modulation protein